MVAVSPACCPACHDNAPIIKFGTNHSGSARCRCKACGKTFTPSPNSRALTDDKEAQIERALAERVSQRGIARMLKVSRDTVRAVRKKGRSG
jgi:transposase-like protein